LKSGTNALPHATEEDTNPNGKATKSELVQSIGTKSANVIF
jgi:hypothetical protein